MQVETQKISGKKVIKHNQLSALERLAIPYKSEAEIGENELELLHLIAEIIVEIILNETKK